MTALRGASTPSSASPRLSVVIPTFDRSPILALCLEALAAQTCASADFEVIVADDGSTDATRATAERFSGTFGRPVRYLFQANAGANAARNRAIEAAQGRLLLFINDDTIATPGMLAEHLAGHDEHPDDRVAILGRVTVSPGLPPSRLAALHLDRAYALIGDRRDLDWRAFFTCNVSVKKSLLDRGGRFEERLRYHEDLELAERLSHHGLRVVYRPAALGYHEHFLTEDEFLRVARREADALAAWARISPRLEPLLGELGFEPALPRSRRVKHRLAGLVVNRATIPVWRQMARRCPRELEGVALAIYRQVYQSILRTRLRDALRSS